MPPRLPVRYTLEVRLGRDGDIEEWLASDTALDRPVLVRVLGPETDPHRRRAFLDAVRGAAGVTHTHIAAVFEAGELDDGAYSISDWAGGLTLAHRLEAGNTLPVHEFLPNAAGLADGLAALHEAGDLHGAIDEGAVLYSVDHPAKLASFGRVVAAASAVEDVRQLAATLHVAVAGGSSRSVPVSQTVDGIPPAVDVALDRASKGLIDASGLAELLRAAPTALATQSSERNWSWRWATPVVVLLAIALILVGIGRGLNAEPDNAVFFPVGAPPTSAAVATSTSTTTIESDPEASQPSETSVVDVVVFDPPPGDGAEHNRELDNLTDGDPSTTWNTEGYFNPLPLIKEGVGVAFAVEGSPETIQITGSANGMAFRVLWAASFQQNLASWEGAGSGTIQSGQAEVDLPARLDGFWLLWLTDIPQDSDGGFVGSVGEVRFRP